MSKVVATAKSPDFEELVFSVYSGFRSRTRPLAISVDRKRIKFHMTGVMRWTSHKGKLSTKWFGTLARQTDQLCTYTCDFGDSRVGYEMQSFLDPANILALLRHELRASLQLSDQSLIHVAVVCFPRVDLIPASMLYKESDNILLDVLEPLHPLGQYLVVQTIGFFHDRREGAENRFAWLGMANIGTSWHIAYASVHESGMATLRILSS